MNDARTVTKAVIPAAGMGTRFLPVDEEPAQGDAAGRRQAVDPVRGRGGGRRPASPTSSSSPGAASARSRTTSTATSSSSTTWSSRTSSTCSPRCRSSTTSPTSTTSASAIPLGLGHAVSRRARARRATSRSWCSSATTSWSTTRALLRSMIEVHDRERRVGARAARGRRPSEIASYGCAECDVVDDTLGRVRSIVEKPKPEDAKSNLAVIGRYVFSPGIFDALDRITPGVGGELQLTDAIGLLLDVRAGVRPRVRARPLRHRAQARLPPRQHRARARPRRPRRRARAMYLARARCGNGVS